MTEERLQMVIEAVDRTRQTWQSVGRGIDRARQLFSDLAESGKRSGRTVLATFATTGRSMLDLFRQLAVGGRGAFNELARHAESSAGRIRAAMRRGLFGGQGRDELGRFTGRSGGLLGALGGGLSGLGGGLLGLAGGALTGGLSLLGSVASSVFGGLSRLLGGVIGLFGSLIGRVFDLARALAGRLLSAAQGVFGAMATGAKAALAALTLSYVYLGKVGTDTNLTLQGTGLALSVLMKNAAGAAGFLKQLREEARTSTFEFTDLADWSKKLIGFGFNHRQTLDMVRVIGDMAVGLKGPQAGRELMDRLIIAFGQIRAKGKVQGDEALQLMEAGLPVRELLGMRPGQDFADLQMGAEQAIGRIINGIRRQWGGFQALAATSLPGRLSNIKDAFKDIAASVTEGLTERLRRAAGHVLDFLSNLKQTEAGRAILDALSRSFSAVGAAVERMVTRLPRLAGLLARGLNSGQFAAFLAAVGRGISWVWGRLQAFVSWVGDNWPAIWGRAVQVWEWVTSTLNAGIRWIGENWRRLWEAGVQLATGAIKVIGGLVAGVINVFRELAQAQGGTGQGLRGLAEGFKEFAVVAVRGLAMVTLHLLRIVALAGVAVATIGLLTRNPITFAVGAAMTAMGMAGAAATARGTRETIGAIRNIDTRGVAFNLDTQARGIGGAFARGYDAFGQAVDQRGAMGALGVNLPPIRFDDPGPGAGFGSGWVPPVAAPPAPAPAAAPAGATYVPSTRGPARDTRSFREAASEGSDLGPPAALQSPDPPAGTQITFNLPAPNGPGWHREVADVVADVLRDYAVKAGVPVAV